MSEEWTAQLTGDETDSLHARLQFDPSLQAREEAIRSEVAALIIATYLQDAPRVAPEPTPFTFDEATPERGKWLGHRPSVLRHVAREPIVALFSSSVLHAALGLVFIQGSMQSPRHEPKDPEIIEVELFDLGEFPVPPKPESMAAPARPVGLSTTSSASALRPSRGARRPDQTVDSSPPVAPPVPNAGPQRIETEPAAVPPPASAAVIRTGESTEIHRNQAATHHVIQAGMPQELERSAGSRRIGSGSASASDEPFRPKPAGSTAASNSADGPPKPLERSGHGLLAGSAPVAKGSEGVVRQKTAPGGRASDSDGIGSRDLHREANAQGASNLDYSKGTPFGVSQAIYTNLMSALSRRAGSVCDVATPDGKFRVILRGATVEVLDTKRRIVSDIGIGAQVLLAAEKGCGT